MEACPPYWEKEETGSSKDGGMESVSGPNPSHYFDYVIVDFWNQVRLQLIFLGCTDDTDE